MKDINITRSAREVVHSRKYRYKKVNKAFGISDLLEMAIISIVIVVIVFTFFFRIVGVVGKSMEPTLQENDRLILSNLFYQPEYGDIVVISRPEYFDEPIIKRVIATPGQTVDIDFEKGTVKVDGVELQEEYIRELTLEPGTITFPLLVGEDEYFVMGDNRNQSNDSRKIGCVQQDEIMGRVLLRLFPINKFGRIE